MSQTLLLEGGLGTHPQMRQEYSPQQLQQLSAESDSWRGPVLQEDVLLAAVLAPLASHHHLSDYHRLKHGQNGAPVLYAPLSLVLPAHIKSQREKQVHLMENKPRLFFEATNKSSLATADSKSSLISFKSESVPRTANVEAPSNSIPLSHASLDGSPPHPVPPTHKPIFAPALASSPEAVSTQHDPSRSTPQIRPPLSISLSQDLRLALLSPLETSDAPSNDRSNGQTAESGSDSTKTSLSHPINTAIIIPPEILTLLSGHVQISPVSRRQTRFLISPELSLPQLVFSYTTGAYHPALHHIAATAAQLQLASKTALQTTQLIQLPSLTDKMSALSVSSISTHPKTAGGNLNGKHHDLSSHPNTMPTPVASFLPLLVPSGNFGAAGGRLGNMILSSCPGKKVRLNGGAQKQGRSAISRDLQADLARIRALGVTLLICCLADDELSFLGAPWPEYLAAAQANGLDIMRIPMPEGLAPISCRQIDEQLDLIVKNYTTEGKDILAHCRGGVGRAGLIACCWMIKMGLCGPIDPAPRPALGYVRRDALALVHSAIRVVRMRRSLKAIETYEQVRFLVDFVEYLRNPSTAQEDLLAQHTSQH